MNRRCRNQKGATMLEAAIAFPVFLLIIFSIISFVQLGMAYEQSSIMLEDAARKAVLVGSTAYSDALTCDDRARTLFEADLTRAAVPLKLRGFSMTRQSIDSTGNGSGFLVSSDVQVSCLACTFLPGFAKAIFSVKPQLFVPAENTFSCPTL